jgi:hypothetical protein
MTDHTVFMPFLQQSDMRRAIELDAADDTEAERLERADIARQAEEAEDAARIAADEAAEAFLSMEPPVPPVPPGSDIDDESIQFCGVHYAADATASLPFAGWKPG